MRSRHRELLEKRSRLAAGEVPQTLDLFCGCGGISVGFQRAGFEIIAGLEDNPVAIRSFVRNLSGDASTKRQALLAQSRDIRKTNPLSFLRELGYRDPKLAVDVLVGGPPCQAYSRIGRAKLQALDKEGRPGAFQRDDRGRLYDAYLQYVTALKPLVIFMENVPEILNYGGLNVAEEVARALERKGYNVIYTLLNAARYGVPQTRERFFLIAFHRFLEMEPTFPPASHSVNLPWGYSTTRATALRLLEDSRSGHRHFVEAEQHQAVLPAVTAREAMDDLALLDGSRTRLGPKRLNEWSPYREVPPTAYARKMREWPGFEGDDGVPDHQIRHLPRDWPIFSRMRPGDEYPAARRIAEEIFCDELARRRERGEILVAGSQEWLELQKRIIPPYDPGKFPNRWRKMDPEEPARTLMAHLAHDSYTHIHYDELQARTISVREAARLQSFPDGFRFEGSMNPAFRQIGNAVPPLLAFALAHHIHRRLQQLGDTRFLATSA